MFVCNCTHPCSVLAALRSAAPGRLVCGSFKVFPSFIDAVQEVIHPQVHHTSPVPSLTSKMLVCCDPWWQRRAKTRDLMHVSNTNLSSFIQITERGAGGYGVIVVDSFNKCLHSDLCSILCYSAFYLTCFLLFYSVLLFFFTF